MDAKERAAHLRERLSYYAKLYYEKDAPEISDYEYDLLMQELRRIEDWDCRSLHVLAYVRPAFRPEIFQLIGNLQWP